MNAMIFLAALTVFKVDPGCRTPILPDADPAEGVVTDTLSLAAAQGEFEAVSFVVRPDRDFRQVDVVPSDLAGPDGSVIPASAADISLVKVWFRPGGRWNTSFCGDLEHPQPINSLVLHDDALVKVDWEKKANFLRCSYPDGDTYVNISGSAFDRPFNHDLEPVRDAPSLRPLDLKKDFRQQFLVTWKVPKNAKPGLYKGKIALSSPTLNSSLITLNLSLTVYPFALPRPRTHHDSREPFVSFWMGSPTLEGLVRSGRRLDRAEKKLRAIFRSMVDHNAVNLSGIGTLTSGTADDLAVRTLLIARQEGMCADPLVNGQAFDRTHAFVQAGAAGGKVLLPEENPDAYRQSLDVFRATVERQKAVMDRYLGHHRCIYQSADECDAATNRRSYGYWDIVHGLGGGTWTDFAVPQEIGTFVDMNAVAAHVDVTEVGRWHRGGAKAVSYAAPFAGVENPDVWRRVKGLRLWYADFDGQHEYTLFDGRFNRWNEFVYRGPYCPFGIVYFTEDGLVSTLAWEAQREALDDVRYFSLLRLRAEAALAASDSVTRQLGRKALVWQEGVDTEQVRDLDALRREAAAWIVKLIDKVGPQPDERETELPPPPLPPLEPERPPEEPKTTAERIRWARRLCDWRLERKEREQAVAALDAALRLEGLAAADVAELSLKRVEALMTEVKYYEVFSSAQLEAAVKALEAALALPGAREEARFSAILKTAEGFLASHEYEKGAAFASARLADAKLSGAHQARIFIVLGECRRGQKDWEKALKAFDEAHRANGNEKDRRFLRAILVTEARTAEAAKDYLRASHCWASILPICEQGVDDALAQRARRHVSRLQPLIRRHNKIKMGSLGDEDDGEAISLDE